VLNEVRDFRARDTPEQTHQLRQEHCKSMGFRTHPGGGIDSPPWYKIEEYEDKMFSAALTWLQSARKSLRSLSIASVRLLILQVGF
jgi:hypothetical protein